MYWDVKRVTPQPGYKLYVELVNGQSGMFDMTHYLDHGIFRQLRDKAYFDQVGILFGAVTWPNGQDISPETLLAELK